MEIINNVCNWFMSFIKSFSTFGTWLTSNIDILGISFSPLFIFSLGTIVVLIGIFVGKLVNPLS